MLRNPPDSWGQLGRMRENEGVNSIKTTGRPLYCRRICRSIEGRRSGTVWSGHASGNLRCGITLQTKFIINLFNSNFYDKYLYGRARMKSAHGTAENIGRSITTNREAVQPAVARRLTGRGGGLSAIADFQTHAPKLPRQAGTALFECRR